MLCWFEGVNRATGKTNYKVMLDYALGSKGQCIIAEVVSAFASALVDSGERGITFLVGLASQYTDKDGDHAEGTRR